MTRKRWIYVNGVGIPAEEYYRGTPEPGLTIIPDIQPFKSSVDGSIITGRAALREHNKRNDVVQTADLAGLPPRRFQEERKSERAAIKQTLINVMNKKGY